MQNFAIYCHTKSSSAKLICVIQTKFTLHRPTGVLSRFIQDIYVVRLPKELPDRQLFIPSMHPYLMFVIKGNLLLRTHKNAFLLDDVHLIGPSTRAIDFDIVSDTIYAGFSFKPAAVNILFDEKMSHYIDSAIAPEEIPKQYDLNSLKQRLINEVNDDDKINMLQSFAQEVVLQKNLDPTLIEACLDAIHKADGCIRSKELQSKFNASDKYLEKLFLQSVGVTPARYAKSFRFFSVVKTLIQESPELANVMSRYEYFDNSHFRKDFIKYTKEKPEDFMKQNYVLVHQLLKVLTPPNR